MANDPHVKMDFNEQKLPTTAQTDVRNIDSLIPGTTDAPTGVPKTFWQQFRIVSGVLWFYDTIANAWQSAGGGGGSSSAGNAGDIQYSDGAGGFAAETEDSLKYGAQTFSIGGNTISAKGILNAVFFPPPGGTFAIFSGVANLGGTLFNLITNAFLGGDIFLETPGAVLGLNVLSQEDVQVGSGSDLANNVDNGFLDISFMSGAPTGTSIQTAAMVFDRTNNKLYIYNGSAWKSVALT
jgi:hypothetical protein